MRGQVSNPCRARRLGAPSYRLGGLFRRRKGAGDSVERLPLVFRCRLFGGGRELGTPLFDSVFAAAGSSAAQGNGGYGESPRFFRRARCPHRAVPGRPGVPALSETWRAGLGFAPSSAPVCALGHLPPRGKACGRVRTPAPTAYTETVPSFVGAGPRPARRSRTSCRLLGKARRGCGIASASIFGKPGPGGPDVIMKSHSDFARREFCFPRQVRVPRYGGSRGTANMDTECPS